MIWLLSFLSPGTLLISLYDMIFLLEMASLRLLPSFYDEFIDTLLLQWLPPCNYENTSCLDDCDTNDIGSELNDISDSFSLWLSYYVWGLNAFIVPFDGVPKKSASSLFAILGNLLWSSVVLC